MSTVSASKGANNAVETGCKCVSRERDVHQDGLYAKEVRRRNEDQNGEIECTKRLPQCLSILHWTMSASIRCASSPWTACKRPIAVTQDCRWALRRWRMCCGLDSSNTTRPIPGGLTAIVSCCRPATVRCCCTVCFISPAMIFLSNKI